MLASLLPSERVSLKVIVVGVSRFALLSCLLVAQDFATFWMFYLACERVVLLKTVSPLWKADFVHGARWLCIRVGVGGNS